MSSIMARLELKRLSSALVLLSCSLSDDALAEPELEIPECQALPEHRVASSVQTSFVK